MSYLITRILVSQQLSTRCNCDVCGYSGTVRRFYRLGLAEWSINVCGLCRSTVATSGRAAAGYHFVTLYPETLPSQFERSVLALFHELDS